MLRYKKEDLILSKEKVKELREYINLIKNFEDTRRILHFLVDKLNVLEDKVERYEERRAKTQSQLDSFMIDLALDLEKTERKKAKILKEIEKYDKKTT